MKKSVSRAAHRRVQGTPAEVPVEVPVQPVDEAPKDIPAEIPGMKSETWSGLPMFRCETCGETTFDRDEAEDHACKRVKYASEGDS